MYASSGYVSLIGPGLPVDGGSSDQIEQHMTAPSGC